MSHRRAGDPAADPILGLVQAGKTDEDLHGYVLQPAGWGAR